MKKHLHFLFAAVLACAGEASAQTWTCGDTLIDPRDGKMYTTIPIGSDCWMAQNLNYGQFVVSDSLATVHSDQFNNNIIEKYCQGNDSNNCILYGGLYEWNEMMNYTSAGGGQGICPPGWHVATDAEWQAMILASGGTFSGNLGTGANDLKALGEGVGADTGTNASGFAARAHGDRDAFGVFYGLHLRFIFWTSTPSSFMPYQYTLWAENDSIYRYDDAGTESGFSCRCVMNTTTSGMNENEITPDLKVYPNPAAETLNLDPGRQFNHGEYVICNMLGQEILRGNLVPGQSSVSLASLADGTYTIQVTTDGVQSEKKRFVVSR